MQKGYCEETDYRGDSRMINNYNAYSFADLINIISAIGDSARKEERVPPVL